MEQEKINSVSPFVGSLSWVGTPKSGKNKNGNEWKSVMFTVSYKDDQGGNRRAAFNAFGEDKVDKVLNAPLYSEVKVWWRPDCHEYQGQWYTKLDVLRFDVIAVPQKDVERPTSSNTSSSGLDLPF